MPEFRQNLATKDWVIISPERATRPQDLKAATSPRPSPAKVADCPFCPGNESSTPTAVLAAGGKTDWRIRVVPNKFPVLVPSAPQVPDLSPFKILPGEGMHEVIVDSPRHDFSLPQMEAAAVEELVGVYEGRFSETLKNEKVSLTMLFKNHGAAAGTSLDHPHTQLIASSIVPSYIRHRMDEAEKYYRQKAECVFCTMLREEMRQKVRIVAETRHFCAFVLFAALSPFHIWILPKAHTPSFGFPSEEIRKNFAAVLHLLLKKLHKGLNDPPFNFVVQSTPLDRGVTEAFHWYMSLVVRTSRAAGFELGSGMFVNTAVPEASAKFINSITV